MGKLPRYADRYVILTNMTSNNNNTKAETMTITTITKITNKSRVGSIPACLALEAQDVGHGTDDQGNDVYFAWGTNWASDDIPANIVDVAYIGDVYENGEKRENFAPVIHAAAAEKLLAILIRKDAHIALHEED